jgi:ethanolamine permease
MSVFGAILMYIISMAGLFKLRRSEPNMNRPFRAPFYPFFPAFALFAATIAMIAMIYFNFLIFVIFVGMLAIGYGYFLTTESRRETAPLDDLIESTEELKAEGSEPA